MIVFFEGIVMCFVLILVCVVGIRNGAVGVVTFYEKNVQKRVVELGMTTEKEIKRSSVITGAALFLPMLFLVPYMVYGVNGVTEMSEGFLQILTVYMIMGLFDRLFIDWYWVGHTQAWLIPGTEDLMPYIPRKTAVKKWVGTLVMYPLTALLISLIMALIIK